MPKRPLLQSHSPAMPPASADLPPDWGDEEDLHEDPADALVAAQTAGFVPPRTEILSFTVTTQGHGRRLDQSLAGQAPSFSRSHLQHLVEQGCVTVDGKVVGTPSRKLQAGQKVVAELRPTAQSQAFVPELMDLPIVFEDDHLLVVDKPVGLVVHPAAGHWQGTLMNGLLAHHAGAVLLPRAGIVHRLNKDTSGLMVVGKTLIACTDLTRAIAARD